jgi:hypothetical protein
LNRKNPSKGADKTRYLLLRWKPPPGKIASRVSKKLNSGAVTKIATVVVTAVRAQIIVIDPPSLVVAFYGLSVVLG